MNEIERILQQLRATFDGDPWHGPSVTTLLKDVTAEQAGLRPAPQGHTIWEIVMHMAVWKQTVAKRLAGMAATPTPTEDWPTCEVVNDEIWQSSLKALRTAHEAVIAAVSQLSESRLNEQVRGQDFDVYFMVHGLIQHDLYHAGQIALLKKMQGLR